MSLIVEDGTGRPDSDSYVSINDADAYHAQFGNAAWALASPTEKESALRRATQYIDTSYTFRGERLTDEQALAWPRSIRAWPVRPVINAACELGLIALDAPLYVDQAGPAIVSETVGPISTTYAQDQRGGQPRYAAADALLQPLTGAGRLSMRIERAS